MPRAGLEHCPKGLQPCQAFDVGGQGINVDFLNQREPESDGYQKEMEERKTILVLITWLQTHGNKPKFGKQLEGKKKSKKEKGGMKESPGGLKAAFQGSASG